MISAHTQSKNQFIQKLNVKEIRMNEFDDFYLCQSAQVYWLRCIECQLSKILGLAQTICQRQLANENRADAKAK